VKFIVISKDRVEKIEEWARKVIETCFETRRIDDFEVYTFIDEERKIGNSELVQKMWKIKKIKNNFLNEVLESKDFPVDELKEMVADEYETGDFMSYFEFVLAELLYKYLYHKEELIMHITKEDELYEDEDDEEEEDDEYEDEDE